MLWFSVHKSVVLIIHEPWHNLFVVECLYMVHDFLTHSCRNVIFSFRRNSTAPFHSSTDSNDNSVTMSGKDSIDRLRWQGHKK